MGFPLLLGNVSGNQSLNLSPRVSVSGLLLHSVCIALILTSHRLSWGTVRCPAPTGSLPPNLPDPVGAAFQSRDEDETACST